jgi:hypothetical protein
MMLISLCQSQEITDIERENATTLRCRAEKLLLIGRIERHPLIGRSGHIVSALDESTQERDSRGIGIQMQSRSSHVFLPTRVRLEWKRRFPGRGLYRRLELREFDSHPIRIHPQFVLV